MYTKLETGTDKDSAYLNDFYLFKRVSSILYDDGAEAATIDRVAKAVQSLINERVKEGGEPLSEATVHLYDRQLKAFASNIYGEKIKRVLVRGG